MKREIAGTILVLFIVIFGLMDTISEIRLNKARKDHNYDAYGEIISQELIFSDDFEDSINEKWIIQDNESKYNRLSMNKKENIQLDPKGHLKLITKQETDKSITTPYMTLNEDDNGNEFNYGYYESRIKFTNNNQFPKGDVLIPGTNILKPWGAFWLYPLEHASEETTEVDIVENQLAEQVTASVHELVNYEPLSKKEASSWFKGNDYKVNPNIYHRYGVYIEPNNVENAANYTFYLDGKKVAKVSSKQAMGNQTIHLSMEIASEDYIEGRQGEAISEINKLKDEAMIVDYVHVYEYKPNL